MLFLIFFFYLLPIPEPTIAVCYKQFCDTHCVFYFGTEDYFLCLENEDDTSCCSGSSSQHVHTDCDPGYCNMDCKRYAHFTDSDSDSKEKHHECLRTQARSSCCPQQSWLSRILNMVTGRTGSDTNENLINPRSINQEEVEQREKDLQKKFEDSKQKQDQMGKDFNKRVEEQRKKYDRDVAKAESDFNNATYLIIIIACSLLGLCIVVPLCILGCVYCAARQRKVQPVMYNNPAAIQSYPPAYGGDTSTTSTAVIV